MNITYRKLLSILNVTSTQLLWVLIFIGLISCSVLLFKKPVNINKIDKDILGDMNEIVLPDKLKEIFHFEPSAILWVEEFNAYLVVSDDTGKGDFKNMPHLFLMDYRGNIQQDMVKIKGINQIEDLESICRDEEGFIYLLASQSKTLKGKKNAVRELFLKTKISGKNLEIVSSIYLSKILENINKTHKNFLKDLGIPNLKESNKNSYIPNLAALDIEGMTYYDKNLYLGLNAPLEKDKYALIWQIKNFSQIFERPDDVDAIAGLFSLWGKVALRSYKQKERFDGISDLLFTDRGDLILSSGRGDGGCIWHIKTPKQGIIKPNLLKNFKNYNPEGLCLMPGVSGVVTVVFDQGSVKKKKRKNSLVWLTCEFPE